MKREKGYAFDLVSAFICCFQILLCTATTSTTLRGQHGASITDLGSEVDSYRGSAPAGAEAPRPILVSADDSGLVNVWWGLYTS